MHNCVLVYRMFSDGSNELLAYVQYPVHAERFCELLVDAEPSGSYILAINTSDGKLTAYKSYTKTEAGN